MLKYLINEKKSDIEWAELIIYDLKIGISIDEILEISSIHVLGLNRFLFQFCIEKIHLGVTEKCLAIQHL